MCLGITTLPVKRGETIRGFNRSQVGGAIERIIIPSSIAQWVTVVSMTMGDYTSNKMDGTMPAVLFTENAAPLPIAFHVNPGEEVSITFQLRKDTPYASAPRRALHNLYHWLAPKRRRLENTLYAYLWRKLSFLNLPFPLGAESTCMYATVLMTVLE